jgi:hypothetical protein
MAGTKTINRKVPVMKKPVAKGEATASSGMRSPQECANMMSHRHSKRNGGKY